MGPREQPLQGTHWIHNVSLWVRFSLACRLVPCHSFSHLPNDTYLIEVLLLEFLHLVIDFVL